MYLQTFARTCNRSWYETSIARCLTFLAVLFFKFCAKSTTLKLLFIWVLAISLTHSGIVAENRQIWIYSFWQTSWLFLKIFSTSSLNPSLSMTSASSRTTVFREEKSIFPLSIWSKTLPVVPTNKSTPLLS